jgi:hypothetical protein
MKIVNYCLIAGLTFGLPLAAAAQQNAAAGSAADVKYCETLAQSYSSLLPSQEAPVAANTVSLTRCSTDTQATIATLESKMKAQKFDLPPRQGVAGSAGSTGNTQ